MAHNFLAVFGHTNMDYLIDLPSLPGPDTSVEMIHGRQFFGGVAGDIARGAAKLGVPTALVSWVGENFPEDYVSALRRDGVDLSHFTRMHSYFTPTCWIMTDKEQNQFSIINQGPMRDLPSFEVPQQAIDSSEMIHITTGAPAYYVKVAAAAKRAHKQVGFDPAQEIHYSYGGTDHLATILAHTDRLFSNRSEAQRMLDILHLADLDALAQRVPLLVTTKGSKGSEIRHKGEVIEVPAFSPERFANPTGAGDAYRAGFYCGLRKGLDLSECGVLGAATASFVVEDHGPQSNLPTLEQVLDRIDRGMRL